MAMEGENWQSVPDEGADIPMETQIWQALPQDLLQMILARLPSRVLAKMRTVSNQWRNLLSQPDALRRITLNYSVQSYPGFLVQLEWAAQAAERIVETWAIEFLGGDSSDMIIYKAPFPDDGIIVYASKSILCCHGRKDRLDFYIVNFATKTFRSLPRPQYLRQWNFIAMDFDTTRRRCTVLLGENDFEFGRLFENKMVIEIYDSESNAWTMDYGIVPRSVYPIGKGIYSRGKIYWVIIWNGSYCMISFTIADKRWREIGWPEGYGCVCRSRQFQLAGCEGRVVLTIYCPDHFCILTWKLKEGPGIPAWCEPNPIWMPERPKVGRVAANSSGWTMMFDGDLKISLCHPKRRLKRSITMPFRSTSPETSRIFVSAFESNNVYWP